MKTENKLIIYLLILILSFEMYGYNTKHEWQKTFSNTEIFCDVLNETDNPIVTEEVEDSLCEKLENTVYQYVEQQPEFQGGMEELMKFIGSETKYPIVAMIKGIQGKVILRFIVTEDGRLCNVETYKSIDPLLDNEAERVIKLTDGKWKPGIHEGKAVNSFYTLPINFVKQTVDYYEEQDLLEELKNPDNQFVMQMTEFEGGEKELVKFLTREVRYPFQAQKDGIEGRVLVEFVVTSEGKLENIKVIETPHAYFNFEAMRVVKCTEGKWIPGNVNGIPINVKFTVPINFVLL